MKTNILGFCSLILPLFCSLGVSAQTPNWSVDINKYQFSMRAYLSIVLNDEQLKDVSDYEIAAFCGNECRGISEIVNLNAENKVAYITIGSKSDNGDDITFSIYKKGTGMCINNVIPTNLGSNKLTFEANTLKGEASSPLLFSIKKGDINGDSNINIVDITHLVSIVKEGKDSNMVSDVNNNGITDVEDVKALSDIIIKK